MTHAPSRRRWHPLTIAAGLLLAAGVTSALGWWLPSGAWLVMCAAAGFATSGSS
ncbi:hypothetical protein AB0J55_16455 [Amycolatopsis sp. NPDC049688]|uniref:hypothetical protein n=1 Tax=Amycolatopsis sp. NPDC049688 TaxID=3154733 RepID=UPI00342A6FBA